MKKSSKNNFKKKFARMKPLIVDRSCVGSSLNDFLIEDGIYDSVHASAIKSVISHKFLYEMKTQKISKTELAERIKTSRSQLDRILDPKITTISLILLVRTARCLGLEFSLTMSNL